MKPQTLAQAALYVVLFWGSGLGYAQIGPIAATRVQVQALSDAPDLQCALRSTAPKSQRPADPGPIQWPDEADVEQQVKAFGETAIGNGSPAVPGEELEISPLWSSVKNPVLRVGIWSDSHLAAGFFTQELQRLTKLAPEQVQTRFVPASLGRPGVRLPLRKICVSSDWQYEPAHAQSSGAEHPGIGLVNMSSRQDGAFLSVDLRNAAGRAQHARVRLLYQQTEQALVLSLRVDGGQEQNIQLQGLQGPAVLELNALKAISTLSLKVLKGPFRLQGLEWPVAPDVRLQMDVFGYPGATVNGWRLLRTESLTQWWSQPPYDVVVMAFGTNEGNVQPFVAENYRQMLQASVAQWRAIFPQAACLLIAPGDRGVFMKRSKGGDKKTPRTSPKATIDLMRFTRVHDEIGRIQKQTAKAYGCHFWNMFEAMGGAGSAYRWARQSPPLMAQDLIHFTVPGYQRLAQLMAKDLGWGPALFGDSAAPAANP